MIRLLDLFSGIGGFSLAARWTGVVETVGFCELDPWCQRVLAKNFPGVPIHDDIKTLTGDTLARFGPIDLITGGFPCQPYSVAGKRGGAADDRALWPAMAAVIAECRPTYVLAENVPGFRSMGLDGVLCDLEALDYTVQPVSIPAGAVGAVHRRERLWVLAHRNGARQPQPTGGERIGGVGIVELSQGVADVACCGCGGRSNGTGGHKCDREAAGWVEGERGIADCPSVGRPAGPGILRATDGVPHRLDRVRGLGNAIVPQVAYELMRVMFADEMEQAA